MKSFVIFAIVVTVIYVINYTVIIVQDLYGKPKDEKSQGESFDVSDMTEEDKAQEVVKKVKVTSDYFNTLTQNEHEPKLIMAICCE